MKQSAKQVWMGIFFLLLIASVVRADDREKYKAFAEEIRKEVWALQLPAFQQRQVPTVYQEESAVILAAHSRLEIDKRTRFALGSFLAGTGSTNRDVSCRNLYRRLILLNDKAAVKEFSEFDFKTDVSKKAWRYDETKKYVLGVRVIKPDGTIQEVETDDYMTLTEGKKGREERQKLAVPGLQPGDAIDVFYYEYVNLENHNLDLYYFSFQENYPMLSYSIYCEIDPKLTTQYRCLNGAPDFKQSINEEKNLVLQAEAKEAAPAEPTLWYSPMRQTPCIVMCVTNPKMKYSYIPPSARKTGVQANPDAKIIQDDDFSFSYAYQTVGDRKTTKKATGLLKEMKNDTLATATCLYNYLVFRYLSDNSWKYNPNAFVQLLEFTFFCAKIPYRLGITTSHHQEPISQLISYRNTDWFIYVPSVRKYYFAPSFYNVPGEIPARFQGQQAILEIDFDLPKKKRPKERTVITLPAGSAADNINTTIIQAEIQGTALQICRNEQYTGTLKENRQNALVPYQTLDRSLRQQLDVEKTREEEVKKKYADDLQEALRKEKETEKENYLAEIKAYHGADAKEMLGYRLHNIGNRADSAVFCYETTYTLNNLVKKAGSNYILSVGKLLGNQLQLEKNDRNRTVDVYALSPRTYEWKIAVKLPAGYRIPADALKKLNTRMENECGCFMAQATYQDGVLHLEAVKEYAHKIEPKERWPQLCEIIDAAQHYESVSVLLKK